MFSVANGRQPQAGILLAVGAAALMGAVVLLVSSRADATQDDEVKSKQSTNKSWQEAAIKRSRGENDDSNSKEANSNLHTEDNVGATHLTRAKLKEERRQAKLVHLAMKSPMYDNVLMLDPQGEVLCTISKKKAKWYINKGLAAWVVGCGPDDRQKPSEDDSDTKVDNNDHISADAIHDVKQGALQPDKKYLQIKILFEPKNRSNRGEEGLYVRTAKQNKCVVCGSQDHHMRHYVVPYAYRTLLPKQYKTHLSHDIVILCPKCHLHCEQHRQRRMTDMEDACRTAYLRSKNMGGGSNASTGMMDDDKNYHHPYLTNHDLYHVRSCALALMNSRNQLPEAKLTDYESIIRNHFLTRFPEAISPLDPGSETSFELTKPLLQKAIDVDYKVPNEHYIPGAEIVVEGLVDGEDEELIADFIRDWRRHFLSVAQPRHLPTGWSVNSSIVCGAD